jgi:hypothetical protein
MWSHVHCSPRLVALGIDGFASLTYQHQHLPYFPCTNSQLNGHKHHRYIIHRCLDKIKRICTDLIVRAPQLDPLRSSRLTFAWCCVRIVPKSTRGWAIWRAGEFAFREAVLKYACQFNELCGHNSTLSPLNSTRNIVVRKDSASFPIGTRMWQMRYARPRLRAVHLQIVLVHLSIALPAQSHRAYTLGPLVVYRCKGCRV